MQKTEYKKFAQKHTPDSPMGKNLVWAFLVGGAICTLGQLLGDFFRSREMSTDAVSAAVSISLIFLSILLTGLDLYDGLAKHAGAGTLVPITGFANAVASPAIEFKTEGYILGVGAKMFVVAGPVITYGVISSVAAGILYYLFLM
ncbi:MAG: stage V sporulation protein AC [Ruminococcaceae bacterium]|nr:stage V sporulation protein AC [Oscillospiraceae bacterium]